MHHNPVKGELSQRHGLKNTRKVLGAFARDRRGPRAVRPRPPGSRPLHRAHEEGDGDLDGGHGVEPVARRAPVVGEHHHAFAERTSRSRRTSGRRPSRPSRQDHPLLRALGRLLRGRSDQLDLGSTRPANATELLAAPRARAQRHRALPADAQPRGDGELPRAASCACTRATSPRPNEVLDGAS